jgi:hypothetical protein
MKLNIKKYFTFFLVLLSVLFFGWGNTGHKIINKKSVESFPQEMNEFISWAIELESNASNADDRKGSDPDEAPKHYIDIDNYTSFVNTGRIPQTWDSVIAIYGYNFVIDQGILPWAIMTTVDTLQKAFERHDWEKAILTASDLGHYVGDGHNPLHITKNYNGLLTGQSGVHSRYESNMINRYQAQISYSGDSVSYVEDVSDYVFSFLYYNYAYVDSVLYADSVAKSFTGSTSSDGYYQKMWDVSKNFTIMLFHNSSKILAELIYTAWFNAGSPSTTTYLESEINNILSFQLEQNYPNPFNPTTKINYKLSDDGLVTLKIYDILGKEITTLVNEQKSAGRYEVEFDGDNLNSGIYFYSITAGSFTQTKKMMLIK